MFLRSLGFACQITDRWQQMRNFRNIVQKGITLALCCLQSFGKGAEDKQARKKNEARDAGRDGERPGCARDVPGASIIRIEENRFRHGPSYPAAPARPIRPFQGRGLRSVLGETPRIRCLGSKQYASYDERKLYRVGRICQALTGLLADFREPLCDRRYGLRKLLACPVR